MTTDFPRLPCTCGFQPDGSFERDCPGCVLYRGQAQPEAQRMPRNHTPKPDKLAMLRQDVQEAEAAVQELCAEREACPYGPDRQHLTVQVHDALEKVKRRKAALMKYQRLMGQQQKD